MSGYRSALVAALVFVLCAAALDAARAKPAETPRLAVIVIDYAGAPPAVLESAKSHVTFIYHTAGVEIDWIERDDPRVRDDEFMKSIVTVSLYSAEMANRAADPDAVVGKAPAGGRTVTVLYHRLEDVWGGRSTPAAFLLGNVIAHEIGHVVLPTGTHSPIGLMVPEMNISVATARPLFFTPEQSQIIRSTLGAAEGDGPMR
jgi:hypothetical protein